MLSKQRKTLKGQSWSTLLRRTNSGKNAAAEGAETEISPALPPRPASVDETSYSVEMRVDKTSLINKSLCELVDLYDNKFPVCIRVLSGLRRKTTENEFLTVEEVSDLEVLTCSHNRQQFSIPLSTEMRFAILHEQEGSEGSDDFKVLAGKEFTVGTLLQCHDNMPKVISATQNWQNGNESVHEGEVLVVKATTPKDYTPPEIKVFSITTREEKSLSPTCPVVFTNRAQDIILNLSDILAYVPNVLPCRACILRYDFGPKCYPANIITLEGLGRTRVLKCVSSGSPDKDLGVPPATFMVPVDLPGVTVAVITDKMSSSDTTSLGGGHEACATLTEACCSTGSEPLPTFREEESPVYEELPRRNETKEDSSVVIDVAGHPGGELTSEIPRTEVERSPSPIYEKPCENRTGHPPAYASTPEGGYVSMTTAPVPSAAHVHHGVPFRSEGEYEDMKALLDNHCEAKDRTKKMSVIYVNSSSS